MAPKTRDLSLPAECVAEPRAYEDIASILALGGDGVPAPAVTQITPPLGEVADAETSISIEEAARHVLACFNAGDIPRAAGLMTENGVQSCLLGTDHRRGEPRVSPHPHRSGPRSREPKMCWFGSSRSRMSHCYRMGESPPSSSSTSRSCHPPVPETLLFVFANQDGRVAGR